MKRAGAVVMLLGLLACGGGGGSPSAPATPAPTPVSGWPAGTVVQLVSGDTGASVSGPLIIAGATVQSGVPLPTAAPPGVTVDVVLPAYLTRQTMVRTGETRLTLWPDTSDFPAAYTEAIVYTPDDADPTPMERMSSKVKTVSVTPSADLQADGVAMDAIQQGVDGLNGAAAAAGVHYVVGGTGDLTVPMSLNPNDSSCEASTRALARCWLSSASEITRAEIVFCTEDAAHTPGTAAHELGHTFGLRHSMDDNDLMARYYHRNRASAPTARETLAMVLMVQRRAGNTWPDNDRNTQAAARRFFEIE